jgi:hypothetical protein
VNDSTPVGLTTQNDANNGAAAYGATVPGGLKPDNLAPYSSVTIKTTAAQDAAVEAATLRDIVNPPDYNLLRNNCAEEASKLLRAAGLAAPHDILPGAEIWDLSAMYNVPINYH